MSSPRKPTNLLKDRHGLPRFNQFPIPVATRSEIDNANRLMYKEILENADKMSTNMLGISNGTVKVHNFTALSTVITETNNVIINPQTHTQNNDDDIIPPPNNTNSNDAIPTTPPRSNTNKGVISEQMLTPTAPQTSPSSKSPYHKAVGTRLSFFDIEGQGEDEVKEKINKNDVTSQQTSPKPPPLPPRLTNGRSLSSSSSSTG